jgi:hypothetical protein
MRRTKSSVATVAFSRCGRVARARVSQGPLTDRNTVKSISHGVREGTDVHAIILNYRKDGSPFWNHLFIAPLRDTTGTIVHFVGVQVSGAARTRPQQEIPEETARRMIDELNRRKGK